MGCAIGAYQAGTVQRKYHWQVLNRHIVNQLVVGTLQKSRVDCYNGFKPLAGQARRKSDRVLLGNADIKITRWETLLKLHHAGALAHGRRDTDQPRIVRRHVTQPLAENLGKGLLGRDGGFLQADGRVKLAGAMVGHRVGLGQFIALSFFSDHMQKLRALEVLDIFQRGDQRFQIVPVNRTNVVKTKFLKQGGRHHHAFGVLFKALGQFKQGGCTFQYGLTGIFGSGIKLPAHQFGQIAVQRAHGRADAHVVVIQDDQQVAIGHAGIVERLKRHTGRESTVTDDGNGVALFSLDLGRQRHAQGRRNGGTGVRRAKGIEFTFPALRETAQAAKLAQGVHALASSGQNFVGVSLVAHIPHHAVVRGVEDVVQGHSELDRPQVGTEMPTRFRDAAQHIGTQFSGQGG